MKWQFPTSGGASARPAVGAVAGAGADTADPASPPRPELRAGPRRIRRPPGSDVSPIPPVLETAKETQEPLIRYEGGTMRKLNGIGPGVVAMLAMILLAPGTLDAQERGGEGDWWRWALAEVLAGQEIRTTGGRNVRIDPDRFHRDRDPSPGRGRGRGRGAPAFCRTGEGHPVFGRKWCVEKGFGLGRGTWSRGDIGDIIFRSTPERDAAILDRSGLTQVLGDGLLERLLQGSAGASRDAPVTGRWLELEERGARVLQLRSGGRPLAELTDLDRDGRVDVNLRTGAAGNAPRR